MRGQTNHNFKQVVNENVLLGLQKEEKSEVCIDSYEWYLETHFNKINKKEEETLEDDMTQEILKAISDMNAKFETRFDNLESKFNHLDENSAIVKLNGRIDMMPANTANLMNDKLIPIHTSIARIEESIKAIPTSIKESAASTLLAANEKIDSKLPTWLMVASPVVFITLIMSSLYFSYSNTLKLKDDITVIAKSAQSTNIEIGNIKDTITKITK